MTACNSKHIAHTDDDLAHNHKLHICVAAGSCTDFFVDL